MSNLFSEGLPGGPGVLPLGFFPALFRRFLLLPAPGERSVAFWRQRTLALMLLAGAILGLPAYLPSVALSLRERLWSVVLVDTLAYGWVVVAALSPRWSHATRVRGLISVLYLVSVVLLLRLGTAGAGLLWIAALPVLAAILISLRAALACWGLAAATLAVCGWAAASGWFDGSAVIPVQPFAWAAWVVPVRLGSKER